MKANNTFNSATFLERMRVNGLLCCFLALSFVSFTRASVAQSVFIQFAPPPAWSESEIEQLVGNPLNTYTTSYISIERVDSGGTPITTGDLDIDLDLSGTAVAGDDYLVNGATEGGVWHATIPSGSSFVLITIWAQYNPDNENVSSTVTATLYPGDDYGLANNGSSLPSPTLYIYNPNL